MNRLSRNPAEIPESQSLIAEFQSSLLELLDRSERPEDVIRALRADRRFAELSEYIDSFEPRMVEVAQELVSKWGKRQA